MEVRPELAGLGLPPHRRDDPPADDDGAVVAPLRLGDVLLEDDVLPHRPERLEQRRHGLRRLGDHRADALRALLELDDRRGAADERESELDRVGRPRADRLRDVDVLLREELHRAQLVARAGDRDRRVEHRDAHHVELPHHREAVVRDRRADARDDQVGVRDGLSPRNIDGRPRETTMWKSSGSATVTSWPRERAASTRRLVE